MPVLVTAKLHNAQFTILRALRHNPTMRYSSLCKASGLDSDVFKFHIRKLTASNLISKLDGGEYALTLPGKEYANNLNTDTRTLLKQPKQSLLMVVRNSQTNGLLLQRRLRQPHFGQVGFLSGPLLWGEMPEATASAELYKQTGIVAAFDVAGFYRKQVRSVELGALLEDVFFTIVTAETDQDPQPGWTKGKTSWVAQKDLGTSADIFSDTQEVLSLLSGERNYLSLIVTHSEATF